MVPTASRDRQLLLLLYLRFRGGLRHRGEELRTLRGLLFMSITVAVIALLMMQPAGLTAAAAPLDVSLRQQQLGLYMPFALLLACLLTVLTSSGPAIHFSPAEINLLFTAPFSRRALLLYKLCFYVFGAFLSSLLITLLAADFASTRTGLFLGALLTLLFIQLFSAVIGQLGRLWLPRLKRPLVLLLSGLLLMLAMAWLFWIAGDVAAGLARVQASVVGMLLLAPFTVYVNVLLAPALPAVLGWALLGLLLNVALVVLLMRLDRHGYEASVSGSLKMHRRWQQARRSGQLWGSQPAVARSAGRPPGLGGVGPLAWRQWLAALRGSRKALLTFLVAALLAGPVLVVVAGESTVEARAGFVFFVAVFLLPRTLVFDFRSDLDAMENFKSLPLQGWKICLGQLVTPVVLTTLIECALLCSTALLLEGNPRLVVLGLLLFLLPFNLLLYGLENLLFLLFPTPLVPVGRVDFDFLGRTLVEFSVKAALLIAGCWLAAIAGIRVFAASAGSWPLALLGAWLVLLCLSLLLLPLLARAYARFDVSRVRAMAGR